MAANFDIETLPSYFGGFLDQNGISQCSKVNFFTKFHYEKIVTGLNNREIIDIFPSLSLLNSYVFECLYTKDYSEVDPVWYHLYSLIEFTKAYCLYICGNFLKAIKHLDYGLIIGADIFDGILKRFMKHIELEYSSELAKLFEVNFEHKFGGVPLPIQMKNRIEIQRKNLTFSQFKNEYFEIQPVIIVEAMKDWPAFNHRRWSLEYLSRIAGWRHVPVEAGSKYTDNEWSQKIMTVNDFIREITHTNSQKLYLAQHAIFNQIPQLSNDVIDPVYCYCENQLEPKRNIWIGPSGTVSPLHTDPYENIFCQVVGKKYLRLFDQKHTPFLYPHSNIMLNNTSSIDFDDVDLDRFPDIVGLPYFDCVINEGELLYIPKMWWHYVKSLSVSFSVSIWWNKS